MSQWMCRTKKVTEVIYSNLFIPVPGPEKLPKLIHELHILATVGLKCILDHLDKLNANCIKGKESITCGELQCGSVGFIAKFLVISLNHRHILGTDLVPMLKQMRGLLEGVKGFRNALQFI